MSGSGPGTDRSKWLPPGTRLNDIYEIEEGIASGGMGEIYRGRAIETGDLVAIKTIRSDVADSEAALGMFRREASALHNLYHEAIVRYYVFSIDRALNRPYLAMEFVSGPSLSDLVKNGPVDFDSVRVLGARVALGLQAAHERGIVHRDISPDNIILPDGDAARAKIIDFGIARQMKQSEGTIIGDGFAGKYNYVSPEQLGMHGGDVTGASDVYSLGLVLAEAIAGRALNMRGNPVEVIQKRQTVPDIEHIDSRMRPLIARMLQSDPAHRLQSMREVAAWLKRGAGKHPPQPSADEDDEREGTLVSLSPRPTTRPGSWPPDARPPATQPPPERGRSSAPLFIAAAAVVVAALGGGGHFLMSGGAPETRTTAQRPEPPAAPSSSPKPFQQAAAPRDVRPAAPERPETSAAELSAYLGRYPVGDCTFVVPLALGDQRLVAEGFAQRADGLEPLARDIEKDLGFRPDLRVRTVTRAQCPVVDMLARGRASAGSAPKLEIASAALRPDEMVMGEARAPANGYVGVARVRADGATEILAAAAPPGDGLVPFETSIADAGAGSGELIVAFAAARPLPSLATGATMLASDFVARLTQDVERAGGRLASAARYVAVKR